MRAGSKLACFVVGFLHLVSLSDSFAQTPDAGAIQKQLEKQAPKAEPAPEFRLKAPAPAPKASDDKNTFEVKAIRFTGNTQITTEELQAVVKSWLGLRVTLAQLDEITATVMNYYREKGLIAQAIVPPQTISEGILEIRIIEARLSSIVVKPAAATSRYNIERAKRYVERQNPIGQNVSPEKIEEAVTLINETSGVRASGTLDAGENLGDTIFNLSLEDLPFITGSAQVSNQGSRSTGIPQALASMSLNNLTGRGDAASVFATGSQGSQYGQVAYNVPVGYSGLKIGVNSSYLHYQNIGPFSVGGGHGHAATVGINASYPVWREGSRLVMFNANLDSKQYENLGNAGVISKYDIQSLTLGLSGNFPDMAFNQIALNSWSFSAVEGYLNIRDMTQRGQDWATAHTDGSYQKIQFSWSRQQQLGSDTWIMSSNLSGQYGFKNLNSAEQFYLGGPNGVRAYPVSQGGGQSGLMLNLELRYRFNEAWQPFAFYDAGVVKQYKTTWPDWEGKTWAGNIYALHGAGLGVRWQQDRYQVNALLAAPLGNNSLLNSLGQRVNADGRKLPVQGWINATVYF